jgi:hypothetical protein
LYVLMSNAGLPEAGDLVLAFAPELLADDGTYRSMADLPGDGRTTDHDPSAAMRRRNAAVLGFRHWRNVVDDGGPSALEPLYRRAVELLGDRPESWLDLLAGDPAADLERSRAQVEELWTPDRSGAAARLGESAVRSRSLHPDVRRLGCCGTLGTVIH